MKKNFPKERKKEQMSVHVRERGREGAPLKWLCEVSVSEKEREREC